MILRASCQLPSGLGSRRGRVLRWFAATVSLAALLRPGRAAAPLDARVQEDEIVTTTTVSNNGSSPMWCVGAPLLVRQNGVVWASISVHDPEAPSYCNTHWELWRRPGNGPWGKVRQGPAASEREPCPLGLLDRETLVVSIQPKVLAREVASGGETSWYCQPALAVFQPGEIDGAARIWIPDLGAAAPFGQHSYRSFGVDPANGTLLLLVIDRRDVYHPTWRDAAGRWHPLAPPDFPVRACYPNVVLRDRAGYVLAIGDIKEPNAAWKAEKFRVLQRQWDYAFRRLFFAWSPDLATEGLRAPLEVDSVDDTAGWMFNLDLLVDAQGRAHLLWVRRTIEHEFLRDRFFPGQPIVESVMHAVFEQGRVTAREALLSREIRRGEGNRNEFTSGRLHELPDGRLIAVLVGERAGTGGGSGRQLWLQELDPRAALRHPPVGVALARPPPAGWFFTNTPRGGSKPDSHLDLLGAETKDGIISLRYLHVFIP